MNTKELEIVGHSLGINVYHAKVSKKKRDKKIPKEYYRNRFCASENHEDWVFLVSLEEQKIMKRGVKINEGRDTLWYVTDFGILEFKKQFLQYVSI